MFDQNHHTTYYERALAVVRAGYQPGIIKVTITAEGMDTQCFKISVLAKKA